MRALIVVESCFGTTAAVADAVAAGLRSVGAEVSVVPANAVPADAEPTSDLLIVGAPTHNRGLPTAQSRAQAAQQGGSLPASGVAEWLAGLDRLMGRRWAAFDTALASGFGGSAAKRIERVLRRLRADVVDRQSYRVSGTPAVLAEGELDRARAWGAGLAS